MYFVQEFIKAFENEKTLIVSVDEVGFGSRKQFKRTYGNKFINTYNYLAYAQIG